MKIALLTDGIYPYVMGGMQKHSYFLAKHLAQKGIEVDLYHHVPTSAKDLENPFTQEERENLNILEIEYPLSQKFPGHYLYERYLYSKEIYEVIKQRTLPDFIYAKGFTGWALLKNREELEKYIPVGVNFHGYEMFQRWPDLKTGIKLQILKQPVKYNISKADYLFSYGGKVSEIICQLGGGSKIIEIPTGIGANWLDDTFGRDNNEKRKFVFVGRPERRKGIKELKEVLSTGEFPNFEFHFVGRIPDSDRMKKQNVIYHGAVQDQNEIKAILDQMDILVCPSYSEGMPNVIMEGMARGLAIIATDVGAVSKMVGSSNGWLIKNDITAGIKKALNDALGISETELKRKKKSSREKIRKNFTWEKLIDKTIKEIKGCLDT